MAYTSPQSEVSAGAQTGQQQPRGGAREGREAYPARPSRQQLDRRDPAQPLSSRSTHVNVGTAERWGTAAVGSALVVAGLARRSMGGALLGLLGGGLLYRSVSGHCPAYAALGVNTAVPRKGILIRRSMTLGRPAQELYAFWRDLENLPRFMKHLRSVESIGPLRSRWTATAPAGTTVQWEAELIDDVPGELIVWRSAEDADIENEGAVRFVPAPGGWGTEVHVLLRYDPPAGKVGAAIAKLFGEEPEQQIEDDLRRFKQIMETGEFPTTQGQPTGRHPLRAELGGAR